MKKSLIKEKVKRILFNVLGTEIEDKASPDEIQGWDSLNHLNIIISLEEEFNIEIPPEDFPKLYKPLNDIVDFLYELLKTKANEKLIN